MSHTDIGKATVDAPADEVFAALVDAEASLEPADGRTVVTITATGVPDGISTEDHVTAFTSTLGNLDRYL